MQLIIGDGSSHRAELRSVEIRTMPNGNVRVLGTFIVNFVKLNGDHVKERNVQAAGAAATYGAAFDLMVQNMLDRLDGEEVRNNDAKS